MPPNINMRYHLRGLIHGDVHNIDYGHWIIFREMDHSRRSAFWDENKKEAIGGPKWEYRDFIVRTRRYDQRISAGGASNLLTPEHEGLVEPNDVLYYIEFQRVNYWEHDEVSGLPTEVTRPLDVKVEDVIFEIDKYEGETPPNPPYEVLRKMEIRDLITILGDHGRVEYYLAITKDVVRD